MNNTRLIYLSLFLLPASILCFEILSTRIASVIFVQDYAFIILSLAILGLGSGGIFSYYRVKTSDDPFEISLWSLVVLGVSLCLFIVAVIELSITDPFIFFFLLFLPFFFGGIVYAQIYRNFSRLSFKLYASDLSGAAVGSAASLGSLGVLGGPNSILLLALIVFAVSVLFLRPQIGTRKTVYVYSILFLFFGVLLYNGKNEFLGQIPIGNFPEKDFYHVYPDPTIRSHIMDSRWSIYGRSDLVQYSHQDMVRQLFIDGAAGTQVYRFNGNVQQTSSNLQDLLLHHTNAIPFLCLQESEKRSMLVIGSGGGKEVLMGLFGGVKKITGVEINPDFVQIVRDHKEFDGGIYSDFPNVDIQVKEGRHFVEQSKESYDLIVMALPSTAQMQNIEPFAMSENFLLTKEALRDYFKILNPEGRMILTVHNAWELMRLLATAVSVFREMGIAGNEIQDHFAVLEAEYAPTVVIKKNVFTIDETLRWKSICEALPQGFPPVTYLAYGLNRDYQSGVSYFLTRVAQSNELLQAYIANHEYDISPCKDDQSYFYKIDRSVPREFLWLLAGIAAFNVFVVWLPFSFIKKQAKHDKGKTLRLPLTIFSGIGIGFMVLEISLFQKLVLYLGSPTISLSVLLSSLLVGMGIGSLLGKNIYGGDLKKRIAVASAAIVVTGSILFFASPSVLSYCAEYGIVFRSAACFLMILPIALFLGIPFPSCIQLLKVEHSEQFVPWMYGVNGAMSVLGSVLAIVLSMIYGFTLTYFVGLAFYLVVFFLLFASSDDRTLRTA